METLSAWVKDNSVDTIECTMQRVFTKTQKHAISDSLCDYYNGKIIQLKIGELVLTETVQPAPFTADDYADICNAISNEYDLPMWEILIDHETQDSGSIDLNAKTTVEISIQELIIRHCSWDTILFSTSEDEVTEAMWQRFQTSNAFKKCPCDRDLYVKIKENHTERRTAMTMWEYYEWYRRSEAMFADQRDKTEETIHRVMENLRNSGVTDYIRTKAHLVSVMRVHPMHSDMFSELVVYCMNA